MSEVATECQEKGHEWFHIEGNDWILCKRCTSQNPLEVTILSTIKDIEGYKGL